MPANDSQNTEKPHRLLTPWELRTLLTPMHEYRRNKRANVSYRSHFDAILGFVYRNRFALACQIQRRFAHVMKSDRTARRHLAEMESLGYLGVAATRSTSPLWPKVYFVTQRGARKLRQVLSTRNKLGDVIRVDRSRKNGYSADHILHEVWLTEFLLTVSQRVDDGQNLTLPRIERRSMSAHPAFRVSTLGRQTWLEPDAMFLIRCPDRGMMCCFVEIDTGTMTPRQLHTKLQRYNYWQASAEGRSFLYDLYRRHGAHKPLATFRLLIVAAHYAGKDQRRLDQWLSVIKLFPNIASKIWLTTVDQLSAATPSAGALAAQIWWRGHLDGCREHGLAIFF